MPQVIGLPQNVVLARALERGALLDGIRRGHLWIAESRAVDLSFSDWTLGGGTGTPGFGNLVVAKTGYRNEGGGGQDPVASYILATAPSAIPAGKQVAAVTLPDNPDIHVFAVAAG